MEILIILLRFILQAENAQYSVHLTDDSDYKWHSAFLIVPNTGYQNTYFTISVSDALLLDYEDENWRNIKIEVKDFIHF